MNTKRRSTASRTSVGMTTARWAPVPWLLALFFALVPASALAQMCERPACSSGERFVRRTTTAGESYGRCESGPNLFGYRSHRIAKCPDGFALNASTGQCEDEGCASGCGQTRPVCPFGTTLQRQEEGPGGPYAVCGSTSGIDWQSHQVVRCREGWRLIAGGQCQKECSFDAAPINIPIDPSAIVRPDLVITETYLRTRYSATPRSAVPAGQPYLVCFTVANQGAAVSGVFRVQGGGLGVTSAPYQNHAGLPAGSSRQGCLEYPTTPASGSYVLQLIVDSRNAVTESREDNNTGRVPVIVSP